MMMFFIRLLALAALLASLDARAAVILLYHHVSDATPAATSVTPEQFADNLERLAEDGFEVVRLDELVARVRAGVDPRQKLASITFDDAYESIINTAVPLIEERGWRATVFVATEPVLAGRAPMMSIGQVRELHERGHLVVNHSHAHAHMVRRRDGESTRAWLQRLRDDIEKAQQLLEGWLDTGLPKYLAYPYGEHDSQVRGLLEQMGYLGFAQRSGALDDQVNWRDVPRIPVNRQFADWSGLGDKVRALPMPASDIQPADGVTGERRPTFSMTLPEDWRDRGLNCFAGGQAAKAEREGDRVRVTPTVDLAPGRSLVNCTASAGEGRFYWYSYLWMRKRDDGQWYREP